MENINLINKEQYQNTLPFPYISVDNILNNKLALDIQSEILALDENYWDRYDNPFEEKYTLRDKNNLPKNIQYLFNILTSELFIEKLSQIVDEKLYNDPTKHWWGIHKYKNGDKLDIHSDAGVHPICGDKKHVTLGIYLSKNWKEENKGHLEIWEGGNVLNDDVKLVKKITEFLPSFNKLILFNNTNNAWHGNPERVLCNKDSCRIFLTISYLSKNHKEPYDNTRKRAFFIKRPNDPENDEKDKLRLMRADENKYKEIYKHNIKSIN
jgi:hypothetical protein